MMLWKEVENIWRILVKLMGRNLRQEVCWLNNHLKPGKLLWRLIILVREIIIIIMVWWKMKMKILILTKCYSRYKINIWSTMLIMVSMLHAILAVVNFKAKFIKKIPNHLIQVCRTKQLILEKTVILKNRAIQIRK